VKAEGRKRIIIEKVWPEIDCGRHPIRRIRGETIVLEADIFADGHEELAAALLYRVAGQGDWQEEPMSHLDNDRFQGTFSVTEIGEYVYTIEGWIDPFASWRRDLAKRLDAEQDVSVELLIGAQVLEAAADRAEPGDREALEEACRELREWRKPKSAPPGVFSEALGRLTLRYRDPDLVYRYPKELQVRVEGERAGFSTWYELFPRSCSPRAGEHGTFKDVEALVPDIAELGFDVLYLPPIHPIGRTNRKGKNNTTECGPEEPGSPWAIGTEEGGHRAVHPGLGGLKELRSLAAVCKRHGMELALDIAFQCAPDHPYVKEHPEWFRLRPDGTIQFAENPPKKYEDIVPINFETTDWQSLWEELIGVVEFWVDQGIRIFRVDNPHTKPFAFWEYLIGRIKARRPEVIFLSEAFTRPKVMYKLAKLGFTQSYTYFTWRNTKQEFTAYLEELTRGPVRQFFQPNFWPNTPDILPEHLQFGGRAAFIVRLALAATLSANYGIYGPAFELCVGRALPEREEYLDSEKYEIKRWDRKGPGNIREFIRKINFIRRENPALQSTFNLSFLPIDNENLLAYAKSVADGSNILVIVVNLDPYQSHSGTVTLPLQEWKIAVRLPFMAQELLADTRHIWQGPTRKLTLDPDRCPAVIYRLHHRLHREQDFDYFM
jgi:starch synthase (maltosyl-transferring)